MKFFKVQNLFSEVTGIPSVLDKKIFPSLNGLRAVSIIMVIIDHLATHYFPSLAGLVFLGPVGVNIFFVISGFLITSLCLKEKVTTSNLSLKNFYVRRVLRILPVAFLYIIAIVILNYFLHLNVGAISIMASFLFLVNISYFQKLSYDWFLGHYWSISTEEQFYLLFPFFLKKRFKLFVLLLLSIIIIAPVVVSLQQLVPILNHEFISSALRYLLKFQGISVGCLFSVLLFKGYLDFGKWGFMITLSSVFGVFYFNYNPVSNLQACYNNLANSIFAGFLIVNNIRYENNFIYKFLNLKILNFIGVLSYSLYIWQQLFLSNDSRFALSKFPINIICLIIVACLSYFYYEKYFLKLKAAFTKNRPKGSADEKLA